MLNKIAPPEPPLLALVSSALFHRRWIPLPAPAPAAVGELRTFGKQIL